MRGGSKHLAVTHYVVQYQSMCGSAVKNVTTSDLVQGYYVHLSVWVVQLRR